jgi:hypothetical protein
VSRLTSRELLQRHDKVLRIVINHSNAGFFAYVTFVLNQLRYCEAHDLFPVVNFGQRSGRGRNAFYEPAYGDNTWDYYFEPVAGLSWAEVEYRLNDPGDELCGDDILQLDRGELRYLHKLDPGGIYNYPYGYYLKNRPRYLDSWYAAQRAHARRYMNRYIRVKSHVVEKAKRFYDAQLAGEGVLGVHMRGSDKGTARAIPRLQRIVPPEEYFPGIDHYLESHECSRIFLATDQEQFVDRLRGRYGNRLVVRDAQRALAFGDGENPFQKKEGSPYLKGEEVLIDCLLLARSDFLLKCTSAVGEYAMYFNSKLRCIDLNIAGVT